MRILSKKTAEEILKIVSETYSEEDFAWGSWTATDKVEVPEDVEDSESYVLNRLGLGEVEDIKRRGGEGMGNLWYQVWYFKDHDVYIRIDGHYESYNGVDFYEGYGRQVAPTEKTVVVYE